MRSLGITVVSGLALFACTGEVDPPAVGTLERDRIELSADASEPIAHVAVREGDTVEPGQLIVQLDDARFAAELRQQEAVRDQALARLAELERGPRQQAIAESRARLQGAQSALSIARRELERVRALHTASYESEQRLDRLREQRDEAAAQRDALRAAYDALIEGTTSEELAQSRSALAAAESAVDVAQIRVERLALRAPVTATVDALPFEVGERPPLGASVATLLADTAPYARIYVPEPLRVHVKTGTAARVRIDGIEGDLAGRLRSIERDPAFTPYFALTQHDRGRLTYVAEVELTEARAMELPTGIPVQVYFDLEASSVRAADAR